MQIEGVRNLNIPILLETSVFISLSAKELGQYNSKGLKIMISPYTFWELLCHLDENWFLYKSLLCKCSKINILDDPRAVIETELKYNVERLNHRLPDNQLIPEVVECLKKSKSLNDFYNSDFIDNNGDRRLIKKCSEEVQDFLDKKAGEYSNFVKNIYDYLTHENLNLDSDNNCHTAIMSLLEGAVISAKNNSNIVKGIRRLIINKYYLYFAYIFERTKQLLSDGRTQPQRNDYEDSLICLHLHLDKSLKFVTKDKGLSKALINSLERLNRIGLISTHRPKIIYIQNTMGLENL